MPWLFDWHDFDYESTEKAFDVALHIGTLIAAIAYFRHDLVVYVREGVRAGRLPPAAGVTDGRVAWLLLLSTVPAALVGAVFESEIDEQLGTPAIIGVSLILWRSAARLGRPDDGAAQGRRATGRRMPSSSAPPRRWPSTPARRGRGSRSRPPASAASTATPPPA